MSASLERIMDDLRREVHKYVLVNERTRLHTGEPSVIARVRRHQWVNSHLPIGWPVMSQNPVHRLIALSKKVIRRLLRWYINPIVDQQNLFNEAVANALADQQRAIAALQDKLQRAELELATARRNLELLERKCAAQRTVEE